MNKLARHIKKADRRRVMYDACDKIIKQMKCECNATPGDVVLNAMIKNKGTNIPDRLK